MSNYIRIVNDTEIWPYGIANLRSDFPQTSFSLYLLEEDLKPYGVYFVYPSQPPTTIDPLTEKVQEIKPIFVEDKYVQNWVVVELTEEEQNVIQLANAPSPDWQKFKSAVMSDQDVNTLLASAMTTAPAAALGLATSLMQISTGIQNTDDFRGSWVALRRLGLVTTELRDKIITFAQENYLPKNFIDIL
jgi:hypothetical protein